MAQTIVLRRSAQTGKVPGTSSLNLGEIAVNTYDGRVFFKKSGSIESIEHLVTTNSITTGSITLTKTGSFGELIVVQDANFQRDIFVTRDIVGNGDIDVLGSLTASLSNGYIWVGNSSNRTQLLATSSLVPGNIYITSSVNAPSTIYDNMIWYDSDTGKSYIRYNDGTSTQWVLQSDPTINTGPTLLTLQEVTDIGYTTDNPIIITNTTNATSSGSGALIMSGGIGVLGDVWARKFYGDGSGLTGVVASYTETDTLDSVLGRGNSSANSIVLTGTTNATSKVTGVIRVAGGIGISKDIYADNLVLSGTLTASLQTGYAIVGNSNGTASAVATSSFSTLLPSGLLSSSNNTFAAYTASTNTFTASINTFTASAGIRLTNLESKSASVDISIINLNSYTASASSSIFHLNASSASQQTSINAINTTTASLLVETANLELFTASASSSIFNLNASSASQQTSINALNNSSASLNTFTSSAAVRLTNLETKSASVDISIANIHTFTASVSTSIFNINAYTTSVSSSLFNHNASSASQQTSINALNNSTASLNTFTASTAVRLTNLETKSASVDISITNLNASSASQQTSINALNITSASLNTFTASASTRLTNLETKSASVDTSISNLNSFTTSVNTAVIFNGSDLIVKGNFYVSGSTTYISSSTLNIGDNIIELNYGGTQTIAGIYVKDATASSLVSGSLLWDGTNDYWIAGKSGSESRILLANANNVLSSSINFNTYTASVDSSITNLNASSASQQISINAINVATASLQATSASLNTFTASAAVRLTNLESKSASVDISIAALNAVSASLNSKTGSYATTGSNTFVSNQIISGNLDLSGSFTSSLLKGYVFVGDGNNRTTITPTSSFGGGGVVTYDNTFDFNLEPFVGVVAYIESANTLNRVYANNTNIVFQSTNTDFATFTTSSSYISSSFTASLQQGYVWVGNADGKSIAFSTSSLVAGGASFGTIVVAGQSDVIADVANDTLTLVAGTNISITTNAAGDSITINSSGGSGDTSALNASTASLNTFTASAAIRLTNLESKSASVDTSISNLNSYTASASGSIFHLNVSSASQQVSINALNTATASLQTETANLETFTASAAIRLTNLETKSASVDISISNLNTYTASASSSVFNLNTYTTSVSSSIFHLNASSASQQTSINGLNNSTGSLNTFTASTSIRLTNLESKSASVDINITNIHTFTASVSTSIFNLNTYTTSVSNSVFHLNASSASQQTSINALNTATASLQTETANLELFTASAAIRLTNLESKSSSVDASISSINSKTASYATTGSNTFVGLQTISGSLDVSQSISSSLPQGYVLVGNGLNRTVVVATSSFGGGQTTDISALNASTASLNTFTASAAIRLTNLESKSSSVDISITNLNASSASQQISINAINVVTASLQTETANLESFTASAAVRLTNLETKSASVDISISALNSKTSSYATTGSNTFVGLQTISGSLDVSQSISSSLPQGYVLVGNGLNRTVVVATSSFAGSGGGLKTKAGSVANTSFTGNPKKTTITFAGAFVDTNYAITITGEDARSWTIESKLAGSFVINANSNTGLSGTTYWIATAYGETT
jgi:uncharacterized coiled-coil protein SlyX